MDIFLPEVYTSIVFCQILSDMQTFLSGGFLVKLCYKVCVGCVRAHVCVPVCTCPGGRLQSLRCVSGDQQSRRHPQESPGSSAACMETHTCRQTERQRDRETDRQTGKQAGRQAE